MMEFMQMGCVFYFFSIEAENVVKKNPQTSGKQQKG